MKTLNWDIFSLSLEKQLIQRTFNNRFHALLLWDTPERLSLTQHTDLYSTTTPTPRILLLRIKNDAHARARQTVGERFLRRFPGWFCSQHARGNVETVLGRDHELGLERRLRRNERTEFESDRTLRSNLGIYGRESDRRSDRFGVDDGR